MSNSTVPLRTGDAPKIMVIPSTPAATMSKSHTEAQGIRGAGAAAAAAAASAAAAAASKAAAPAAPDASPAAESKTESQPAGKPRSPPATPADTFKGNSPTEQDKPLITKPKSWL